MKSHGRLDPTLRMREVVHARSIEFLRERSDRLSSGRILCEKEIFFFLFVLRVKNQNQFGRVLPFAFALKCNRIYLLFSSLSDFHSFRWRVHLSYGVCGLRARVQLKILSSLLKVALNSFQHLYFDGLLWPLLITWCYNHGIKELPNLWWTRCYYSRDTIGYHSNSITC